jgi:transcriptional regulator with XRE-family HTH domain
VDRPPFGYHEWAVITPGTLGAAFRAKRWERRLDQQQAAQEIGVSVKTYWGWETNRREPDLRNIPAAIRFLGSDWRPDAGSLGDRIRQTRTALGLSIEKLATFLGTNPSAISKWEGGRATPSKRSAAKLQDWLLHAERSELMPS